MLDRIAAITAEAGRLALSKCGTDYKRWEKEPGQPVCEVDLEVDAFLHAELTKLDPGAGWLSEETADESDRIERPRVWVVDPIDGTRDYLRGRPGWCISVALVEHRAVRYGVLAAAMRDELWTAEKGKGAWLNGMAIRPSGRVQFAGARIPTDSLPKVDSDLAMVEKPNSIALRIAMVADGRADLLATLRWGNEWDIAAAVLIAEEAGARVTGALGQPLTFNTPGARAFGVLATTPAIHEAAVERLRDRAMAVV